MPCSIWVFPKWQPFLDLSPLKATQRFLFGGDTHLKSFGACAAL